MFGDSGYLRFRADFRADRREEREREDALDLRRRDLDLDRDFRFDVCLTRSGSLALPVSRFHSSKVSGLIFPSTRRAANLRRCALLLKGIGPYRGGSR